MQCHDNVFTWIWWTAFLVLAVTDLDTCKKRYWARFGCSIIWWRQAFTSGTQHVAQEGLCTTSNLLPSHMKCRVGLLQQSRPFSTVYSKREAALESSLLADRSEPSAAFSEGWSAVGRQALKLFLLGHLPLSLSRGEYIGSFRLRWLPTQCGSSWEVESSLGTPHLANKASRHWKTSLKAAARLSPPHYTTAIAMLSSAKWSHIISEGVFWFSFICKLR